jgi:hypothetical protein
MVTYFILACIMVLILLERDGFNLLPRSKKSHLGILGLG